MITYIKLRLEEMKGTAHMRETSWMDSAKLSDGVRQ